MLAVQPIGKEADNLEDRQAIGEDDDLLEYQLSASDRIKLIQTIRMAKKLVGVRKLTTLGRISHHTLAAILLGKVSHDSTLTKVAELAARLASGCENKDQELKDLIESLKLRVAALGRAAVARELKVDASFLMRILAGKASLSSAIAARVKASDPI